MPYLFTHFTREDEGGEQVYFSVSPDGLHWQDLREGPALVWNQGDQGVRDPFIVQHPLTGEYFIMATDLCIRRRNHQWGPAIECGSRDVVFWSSRNLVDWSEPWSVTLAPEGAGCAWAPEAVWDEERQAFLIFFAAYTHDNGESRHRIYAAHTGDFRTFSPVFKYIEWPEHVIDTTIIHEGGMYYRFSASHDIKVDCGPALLGAFRRIHIPAVEALAGVEGPECYRLPDGRWCLIADRIRENAGYVPVVIDDPAAGIARRLEDSEFCFGGRLKRHGGVVAISEEEYLRLLNR
ncbi:MAG: 1,4-beta-xylanase [Clostridiales bacterium]|nr:1,4-beta-xylanase [Clostridiales bacterium]